MDEVELVLISAPKILAIEVRECNEPLVDLKDYNFAISASHIVQYEGYSKVRETVAHKLVHCQNLLPKDVKFLFSEGYRPLQVQRKIYEDYFLQLKQNNPEWNEEKLKHETAKFIAPPHNVPPHTTGGAIDLTLINENGEQLDMGAPLDETPDKNENRNYTFAPNISAEAKRNRKILYDVLSNAGFVNYPTEWWHWSYGDKYWAYQTKHPFSIYGSI